jgi:hypothetical protein
MPPPAAPLGGSDPQALRRPSTQSKKLKLKKKV